MSLRENFGETIKSIRKEYKEIEFSDKILDLISIVAVVLFLVAFFSVYFSGKFNPVNITFILYPMAVAGLSSAFRMRKRESSEEIQKMFKEWIIIFGTITAIALLIIILAAIFA